MRQIKAGRIVPNCVHLCPCAETDHSWSYCSKLCPPLSLCWNRSKLVLLCQLMSTSVTVLRQITSDLIMPTCVHLCSYAETDQSWSYCANLYPPLFLCWDRSKLILLCQFVSTSVLMLRQIKAALLYNPTASVMHLLCLVVVCLTTESILWDYVTSNYGMFNEYRIGK